VAALTNDGAIVGTVGYMSPEQAAGRPAGLASDQFSFGVILYEMLCRRRPFERATAVETLSAVIREQATAIETVNADVTFPIRQIVERCLAKDPRDRYADTRDLASQLRQIRDQTVRDQSDGVSESGASHVLTSARAVTTVPSGDVTTAGRVTRRRALWVAGAAVTTVAAGLSVWRLWPNDTGIRVLAVLPFANAAHDEDDEYLCDGITESLIQQISRLPSLTVMARSTVFNFRGKTIDPRAAGRQLGVDAILTDYEASRRSRSAVMAARPRRTPIWGVGFICASVSGRRQHAGAHVRARSTPPRQQLAVGRWHHVLDAADGRVRVLCRIRAGNRLA
jgi:eukaryotic-like serine/threonine-protein kinase